jgi:exodeoxyribonuclease VII small subunit
MTNNTKPLDYQNLKQELDEIIMKLQDDGTSIDESLQLYERGVAITAKLTDYLQKAENKLLKINAQLEDK